MAVYMYMYVLSILCLCVCIGLGLVLGLVLLLGFGLGLGFAMICSGQGLLYFNMLRMVCLSFYIVTWASQTYPRRCRCRTRCQTWWQNVQCPQISHACSCFLWRMSLCRCTRKVVHDCIRVYFCHYCSSSGPVYLKQAIWPVSESSRRSLRSVDRGDLFVLRANTSVGQRSFSIAAPVVWNALPPDLRSTVAGSSNKPTTLHDSSENYCLRVKLCNCNCNFKASFFI